MSPWGCIIRLDLRDTFSGGFIIFMGVIGMKSNWATAPVGVSWLVSKLVAQQQKRRALEDADTIDNLERLHKLKEKGILTNEEFATLKEKLMGQI